MSSKERPTDKRESSPSSPRPPRASGRSGRGADSVMKQLREWEQRRARESALPPRDKPSA